MEDLLQTARELKNQGQLNAAVAVLKRVIELDIDHAEAYFELGLIFYAVAEYEEAVKALRVANALMPDQGVTYYHLARAYQAVGDVEAMRSVRFHLALVEPDLYAKLDRQRTPPVTRG